MSPREEEEFELVLGNKQLLSLFFLVVVLFGVFFSFGYTVGYNRGESSRTRDVATAGPAAEPSKKVQLPEALFQDAPKSATPGTPKASEPAGGSAAENDTSGAAAAAAKSSPAPSIAQTAPATDTPKPRPVPQTPRPAPPPPSKTSPPPKTAPAKSSAPAKTAAPAPQPSAQAVANATHIQVAAVRVKRDAEVYVEQLRAKGHPAALSDQGDGWFRVLVGPFNSVPDAEAYQERLRADGVEKSMLRRR